MTEEKTMRPHLLIVDDDHDIRLGYKDYFSDRGYRVFDAGSAAEMREVLKKNQIDVVLLDIHLRDGYGLELLEEIRQVDVDAPEIIMITGQGTVTKAVEAMKKGAFDFIEKDNPPGQFEPRVTKAIEHHQLKRTVQIRAELTPQVNIIGNSDTIRQCLTIAEQVAKSDRTVLILGETGTGKGFLARFIHEKSARQEASFITISCTNLSESLTESELFGHEKGSFTGAVMKRGKVELADRGTLFLDEIGDTPLGIQAKLLRFVESNEYERVGGIKTHRADVRILAATHQNLAERSKTGRFREDLYYRLQVLEIRLPALRERPEDIPPLVNYFLAIQASETHRPEPYTVTSQAMDVLTAYHWPGNIRQLRSAVQRATILSSDGIIKPQHLQLNSDQPTTNDCLCHTESGALEDRLQKCKNKIIAAALNEAGGNQTLAATLLKVDRAHLNKLIRSHKIEG